MQDCHRQIDCLTDGHQPLVVIIVSAFTILQLLVLAACGYTPYPDSNAYIEVAREAIAQGSLYPTPWQMQHHAFLWNIGAILLTQWSLQWFHSVTPLLALYALMKGLTAWFFYHIALALSNGHTTFTNHRTAHTNHRTALIALIIYVLYPANYGECTSVLSELPFMFFTMAGIYLALCHNKPFLGAMLLAIANCIRPMGIIFLMAIAIYLLFANHPSSHSISNRHSISNHLSSPFSPTVSNTFLRRLRLWRSPFPPLFSLLAGYLSIIILIGIANYARTSHFLYQAKTGWMALACYSYDHTSDHSSAENPRAICNDTTLNIAQKDRQWRQMFIDWAVNHPADYAAQMPAKLAKTYISDNVNLCVFLKNKSARTYLYEELSLPRLLKDFPHYTMAQLLTLLNLAVYYAILLLSLLSLRHFRHSYHLLPLAVILLGTLLLLLVGHGEARFHIPFMPFFILLAAETGSRMINTKARNYQSGC